MVLLHGAGCDSALLSWREVIAALEPDFTVYAPDLLGYGGSDHPKVLVGEAFYPTHIDAIHQMAQQLGLARFAIAGLSMGGAIAIGYALQYPTSISALIPVDSWGLQCKLPFHRLCWWFIHRTDFTLLQYKWLAKSPLLARWSIAYSLIGNRSLITPELVDEVLAACQGDRAGQSMLDYQRSSCLKKGAYPYYGDALAVLPMPVIFVTGERDPLVPLKEVQRAARMSKRRCVVLKSCKHWSVKENSTEFAIILHKTIPIN